MPTLCLTMIVKNESKVILRALESVCQYLDYWCIHDTGSTDGTQKLIQDFFQKKGIPGELHETPWRDFGYNRTKAVESGRNKADYQLLMDADFVFCVKDTQFKDKLSADGYNIKYEGNMDYRQNLLVRSALNWRYVGVTHEYIHSPQAKLPLPNFDGFTFNHLFDGGSRQDKFERDVRLLEQGIKDEPKNGRYYFYLGQSYSDLGKYDKAIPNYQKRIDFGGWPEEVYYSLYRMGICQMKSNKPFSVFSSTLLRAFFFRPQRLEALHALVKHCRLHQDRTFKERGFHLGMMGINTAYPKDLLFIEKPIHTFQLLDEVAMCAHFTGHHLEACQLGERILRERHFPTNDEERLRANNDWYLKGYREHFGSAFGEQTKMLSKNSSESHTTTQKDKFEREHQADTTAETPEASEPRIAIFANYSSIGGSELSIKELHKQLCLHYGADYVVMTENYQRAQDFKPNILISQQTYIEASNKLAKQLEIPLYIMVRGPEQYTLAGSQCRLIIYNSDQLLEMERNKLPAGVQTTVLQPSINLNVNLTEDKTQKTNTEDDDKYITLISSTTYGHLKGYDLFIALARRCPDLKFQLVGKARKMKPTTLKSVGALNPPEDNDWALGQRNDLPENLTVVNNTRQIETVYRKTKILIVASIAESFGRVAVEAASYGIPAVCSDLPGLREATVNSAIYVSKHRSVLDFKNALEKVLANYDDYQTKTKKIVDIYRQRQETSLQSLYGIIDSEYTNQSSTNQANRSLYGSNYVLNDYWRHFPSLVANQNIDAVNSTSHPNLKTITRKQNFSTPGVRRHYEVKADQKYLTHVVGWLDSQAKGRVRFWLQGDSDKSIQFDSRIGLIKPGQLTVLTREWTNKNWFNSLDVGLLFDKEDTTVGNSFHLTALNLEEQGKQLFTVLIPAYNSARYLRRTIDSVLQQTYQNWELLVIDDGSTDDTAKIVKDVQEELHTNKDTRTVTLIQHPNGANLGCYPSLNQGLKQSRGHFVAFLGSDDWLHQDFLSKMSQIFNQHPEKMACLSQFKRIKESSVTSIDIKSSSNVEGSVHWGNFVFRRDPVINTMGYWDSVRFGGDTEYINRFSVVFGERHLHRLQEIVYFATDRPDSLTKDPKTQLNNRARREYQHQFNQWHQKYSRNREAVNIPYMPCYDTSTANNEMSANRPFPVDDEMLPQQQNSKNSVAPTTPTVSDEDKRIQDLVERARKGQVEELFQLTEYDTVMSC